MICSFQKWILLKKKCSRKSDLVLWFQTICSSFCCLPRCRWWASCPESRARVGPVFGHPDRRDEDWCCLTWRTFFKRSILQINHFFFPSRPTFLIFIIMDFLMVDVWIYYMWPTAESYDLRSSRELRGFLLDFAVGHPKLETGWKKWGSNTGMIWMHSIHLSCFWRILLCFLHEAWSDSRITTPWHFDETFYQLWTDIVCWSRRVRSLKQDLTFACSYRLLGTFFTPSLCSFTVPPWKARSTPKFWWR